MQRLNNQKPVHLPSLCWENLLNHDLKDWKILIHHCTDRIWKNDLESEGKTHIGIQHAKAIFTSTFFPYLLCNSETAFLFVWSTCPRACFFAAIFVHLLVSTPSATTTRTHVTVLCSYIEIHARACQRSVLHTKEFYRYVFCECFPRDCEGTWKAITANTVKMRH